MLRLTYCPSNVIGGLTGHFCNALGSLTLTIHNWMSGFLEPGVGYRTVRVSGNDVLLTLCTAITEPVSNHGYTIVPTSVSLNDANIICDPSSELQIASGVANISSVYSKWCISIWVVVVVIYSFFWLFVRRHQQKHTYPMKMKININVDDVLMNSKKNGWFWVISTEKSVNNTVLLTECHNVLRFSNHFSLFFSFSFFCIFLFVYILHRTRVCIVIRLFAD